MPTPTITLSDAARETAEFYSSPAKLERQACREIAAVLGRARFKTFSQRTMRFDITFEHAGEPFTLVAKSADTWLVETQNWERPCPPYPHHLQRPGRCPHQWHGLEPRWHRAARAVGAEVGDP
jgi:hypothetical protein